VTMEKSQFRELALQCSYVTQQREGSNPGTDIRIFSSASHAEVGATLPPVQWLPGAIFLE
jgi:hypothetical protein